jgi:hypothetical protein
MMSSEEHGKMSHATEPGKLPGVHIMKNGLELMATAIQVEINVRTRRGGRQDERLDESRSSDRRPLLKRA